jgi:caprin-1
LIDFLGIFQGTRLDFLAGTNNAAKIDADDMNLLEKFLIEVTPTRPLRSNEPSFVTSTQNAADVLSNVVDGKPKEFGTSTYSHVRDVLQKIQTCGYFEKDIVVEPEAAEPEVEAKESEDLESVSETADVTEERGGGVSVMAEEQRKVVGGAVGGSESIPEMVLNHREQTPIQQQQHHQQQQLPVLTPNPNVLPNNNNKEFGGAEPMAPSAKNVPVPMFKCPPQLVHQIPLPQQPAPIPVAPNLMASVGIVPPQVVAPVVSPTNLQHIAPTTVRAVEQAYFKHAQFMQHQPQPMRPQPPQPIHEVIGTANFFFLQESELDSPDIPSPAPGFPAQPPLQQHPIAAAINVTNNKPSQQPTPPPLTHNHNIVPASAQIQPPLPANVNLHHNPSPIPVQTPSHLSQPQMQHGTAPGIPTQTYTNQSFSGVTPAQNKAPQQIFSPPGLGRSPASNTSATVSIYEF